MSKTYVVYNSDEQAILNELEAEMRKKAYVVRVNGAGVIEKQKRTPRHPNSVFDIENPNVVTMGRKMTQDRLREIKAKAQKEDFLPWGMVFDLIDAVEYYMRVYDNE